MIYNSTPFIEFFDNPYIVLSAQKDGNRSADLSIDYSLDKKAVIVYHYDPQVNERNVDTQEFSDADSALKHIVDILSRYPRAEELPRGFSEDIQTYFAHVGSSKNLHAYVAEGYDCETCGVNESHLEAYYFPAFSDSENGAASLAVYWTFGCYGGDSASGKFDEVKQDVLDILERALESCEIDYTKNDLKDFIKFIKGK